MLYFAYGSNMSVVRLKKRVPSAIFKYSGALFGHKLAFHKIGRLDGSGKCDAYKTDDPSDYLIGVVYQIDPEHKSLLDGVEGIGHGYEIKDVYVKTLFHKEVRTFTYYATNIDSDLKPFQWYKDHVVHGARENKLPVEYIDTILSVESIEDPDKERTEEELGIYKNIDILF